MRTVRIWLLLLLALLIPVRGAIAATMLCLPSGSGTQNEQLAADHSHHEHMHDAAADHDAQAGAGHHDGGHHPAGASGKCTLCSACCSSASLLNSVIDAVPALKPSPAAFPDLSAPAPTFLSDGQERPPRSI